MNRSSASKNTPMKRKADEGGISRAGPSKSRKTIGGVKTRKKLAYGPPSLIIAFVIFVVTEGASRHLLWSDHVSLRQKINQYINMTFMPGSTSNEGERLP
ncbi:hypothetical protein SeLEV6574_g05747 [Synchytrium endobioticum]|uniref:Uncharacterized protein n=1 Tax=Synchytrium endobioticum TaxID=286115 RepID=A0A507CSJ0_9FUNG|nr:hypothetical protein SeLEV6574_g05747 [Synchytrium endobioticum]